VANLSRSSLALISGRQTIAALETLSILTSSYLYALCQALDLRAMQSEFLTGLYKCVSEEMDTTFSSHLQDEDRAPLTRKVFEAMRRAHDETSTMDAQERMRTIAAASTTVLLDFITGPAFENPQAIAPALSSIPAFRSRVAAHATVLLDSLRREYLSGGRGPTPASKYLNRTKPVYEFVRLELGIRMHGSENYSRFANGLGVDDVTIGQNVSLIHEAIRDGKMQSVVANLFA
jgi:phenylalanine ammonia-lyase